jgi:hypothetical protein
MTKTEKMKNLTLIILLVLTTNCIFAQSRQDQAQILQKCIELQELQQYYPLDAKGNQKPLIINYWHPVLFPTDLTLLNDGKNVEFREMSLESDKNAEAYFLFKKFVVLQSSSVVKFDFSYDNFNLPKLLEVMLDLAKVGDAWEISGIQVSNKE